VIGVVHTQLLTADLVTGLGKLVADTVAGFLSGFGIALPLDKSVLQIP